MCYDYTSIQQQIEGIKIVRKLRKYQRDCFRFTKNLHHFALFLEMRLGKTLIAIRRIQTYPDIKKVLIVCPLSAMYGWQKELEYESIPPAIELTGTRKQRLKALRTNFKWFIINKEGHLAIREISEIDWNVVVLDESTFIKNPKAGVSKFYCGHFRNVKHRILLTGTPAPEGEIDYFQQMKFLNYDIFGDNYWQFRNKYFLQDDYNYYLDIPGQELVRNQLSKNCYFLSRKDVQMGGEKIREQRRLKLDFKARKIYKQIINEFLLIIDEEVLNRTIFTIVQYGWLRQLTGGFVDNKFLFNGKLNEIKYLLETELKGQQIVIWAQYINELKIIHSTLRESYSCGLIYGEIKPKERDVIRNQFSNKKTRILIAQPETFKYGVDLSSSDTVIYYSSPSGLETRQQSEDRVINVTKNTPALIIDLVMENTIDEDIIQSLIAKESKQKMMKRIVRRIQKNEHSNG